MGFKLKRKRFVIETVHLGVEGGVGERRTEPAPEIGRMLASVPIEERGAEDSSIEGVEKISEGVDMPRGPKDDEKRVRGKVRFGNVHVESDRGGHTHGTGAGRPVVRHDRMDLYEF